MTLDRRQTDFRQGFVAELRGRRISHFQRRKQDVKESPIASSGSTDIERCYLGLKGPPACATELSPQEITPNRRQDLIWSVFDKGSAKGAHPVADRLRWVRPASHLGHTCPTSDDGCMAGVTSSSCREPTLHGYKRCLLLTP